MRTVKWMGVKFAKIDFDAHYDERNDTIVCPQCKHPSVAEEAILWEEVQHGIFCDRVMGLCKCPKCSKGYVWTYDTAVRMGEE